jgi:hypothetical protein
MRPFKKKPQMTSEEFKTALREAGFGVDHGRIVDVSGRCPGFASLPSFLGARGRNRAASEERRMMAEPHRRLPAPWHADPMPGGYVVRDANGQALAYVYSRENDAEARQANVLTKDEARRIAVNIARLPELLHRENSD